jgi:ATP-dependent helicase Lhr and Lhr-like helicase
MLERKTVAEKPEALKSALIKPLSQWFFGRFKEFSLPQLLAVMEIQKRKNILVSAPTGATKTLTAFMSILNELVDLAQKDLLENRIYCVYVSPLKALNNDILHNLIEPLKEIEAITGRLGIRVAVRTGDTSQNDKAKMLKETPHILITTPESLGIVLSSIKLSQKLQGVSWLIIDEIHALAENKRGANLSLCMERLEHYSDHLTRIGLSATIAPLEEIAKFLVGDRDCTIVDVQYMKNLDIKVLSPVPDMVNTTPDEINEKLYTTLHSLISKHKTTLIFTNTRSATERVVDNLKHKYPSAYGENIAAHHGSLSAQHRLFVEDSLRQGRMKVVVSSTSLELGIDIGHIDLVICLGSPKSIARAIQRIGRSGHMLKATTKGRIIVLDRDDLVECAILAKEALDRKIDRISIPRNCLDVLAQNIYGMAIERVWDEKELFLAIKRSYCFMDLTYTDYDGVLSYLAGEYGRLEDRHFMRRSGGKKERSGREESLRVSSI